MADDETPVPPTEDAVEEAPAAVPTPEPTAAVPAPKPETGVSGLFEVKPYTRVPSSVEGIPPISGGERIKRIGLIVGTLAAVGFSISFGFSPASPFPQQRGMYQQPRD